MTEVIKVEDCGKNMGDYDVPIYNAILIPKNATNGDMIKALFPNAEIKHGLYGIEGLPLVCLCLNTNFKMYEASFAEDWWNAPYRKSEDEEW